jgi:hypothetical protein
MPKFCGNGMLYDHLALQGVKVSAWPIRRISRRRGVRHNKYVRRQAVRGSDGRVRGLQSCNSWARHVPSGSNAHQSVFQSPATVVDVTPQCYARARLRGGPLPAHHVVYRMPSGVILVMRSGRRCSGKNARYTTLATRPSGGGGISGGSLRKGDLAGTRGCTGRAGSTALKRAHDHWNPFVVDEAFKGIRTKAPVLHR